VTRRQCKKCPWKVSTNPHDIPNGYSEAAHRELEGTIASDETLVPSLMPNSTLRIMACHDSPVGRELACVGWLHHQLGVGNNIALRIAVMQGRIDGDVEVVGPQHERFEDTLP
jgi:hypothetical protein